MGLRIEIDLADASPDELRMAAALINIQRGIRHADTEWFFGENRGNSAPVDAAAAFDGVSAGDASSSEVLLSAEAVRVASVPLPPPVASVAAPSALPPSSPPLAVAPAAPAASAGVELDSNGLPWDGRIHAKNRAKVKDGSWRSAVGVDKETVTAIEAELRATMGAVPASPLPPPAPAVTASEAAVVTNAPNPPIVTDNPPPIIAPPTPPPAPAPETTGFTALMRKVTEAQSAGAITVLRTSEAIAKSGVTALKDLINRPDLVPHADAWIDWAIANPSTPFPA